MSAADWDLWKMGIVGKNTKVVPTCNHSPYGAEAERSSQISWLHSESDAIDYIVTPCLTNNHKTYLAFYCGDVS